MMSTCEWKMLKNGETQQTFSFKASQSSVVYGTMDSRMWWAFNLEIISITALNMFWQLITFLHLTIIVQKLCWYSGSDFTPSSILSYYAFRVHRRFSSNTMLDTYSHNIYVLWFKKYLSWTIVFVRQINISF